MWDAAAFVKSQPGSGDGVEAGRGHVFHALPGPVAALQHAFAHLGIGIFQQTDFHGHGFGVSFPGRVLILEFQASGDLVVEPAPGRETIHVQFGGQVLLFGGHLPKGALAQALQVVIQVLESRVLQ